MDEFNGSVKELRGLFKIPKPTFKLEACINKFATQQRDSSNKPMETVVSMGWTLRKTNKH